MTRQDVADYLNLPPGTIKAAVDALETRGLVQRHAGAIAITNRAAFDALVEGENGLE
jgi:DNA-binding MarR family transcriptional regulator